MAASRKIHRKLRFATGGAGAGAALGTWLASLIGVPSGAATDAIVIICAAVVALAAGYQAKAAPSDVPPPPQPPAS